VARTKRRTIEIAVDERADGVRLDRFVRKLLPELPLSRIHAMIRKREARLNGAPARGGDRLRAGDSLSLCLAPGDADGLEASLSEEGDENAGGDGPFPVLFRDEHMLAFDKPTGVAAHPGSGHALRDTVLGALYRVTGSTGTGIHRPALVGRLDRDTSGVQLAGVSPRGLRELSRLSREGEIHKTYLAVVRDHGLKPAGRIDLPLMDTRSGRRRMRVARRTGSEKAMTAVTVYRVIARRDGCALVEAEPETGRQHQIRAHFSHIGAPLAGDARYGDRAFSELVTGRTRVRRLFLHCARVHLTHPTTNAELAIASDLPHDLQHVVDLLLPGSDVDP